MDQGLIFKSQIFKLPDARFPQKRRDGNTHSAQGGVMGTDRGEAPGTAPGCPEEHACAATGLCFPHEASRSDANFLKLRPYLPRAEMDVWRTDPGDDTRYFCSRVSPK